MALCHFGSRYEGGSPGPFSNFSYWGTLAILLALQLLFIKVNERGTKIWRTISCTSPSYS